MGDTFRPADEVDVEHPGTVGDLIDASQVKGSHRGGQVGEIGVVRLRVGEIDIPANNAVGINGSVDHPQLVGSRRHLEHLQGRFPELFHRVVTGDEMLLGADSLGQNDVATLLQRINQFGVLSGILFIEEKKVDTDCFDSPGGQFTYGFGIEITLPVVTEHLVGYVILANYINSRQGCLGRLFYVFRPELFVTPDQ